MRYASSPRSTSFSRWLLAAIIFIAILTFANKEVSGVGTPTTSSIDTTKLTRNYQGDSEDYAIEPQNPLQEPDAPGGIPEPATLILLGTGLSAAWAMRRKMNT